MKGQISMPSSAIASIFITLLLLSLTLGNTQLTNQFIKSETLDIQVDRVVNGVLGLESIPKGYLEIDMSGYGIKVDNGNISMNYSGSNVSKSLDNEPIQSNVVGPGDYRDIEENLCIRKKKNEISVQPGDC